MGADDVRGMTVQLAARLLTVVGPDEVVPTATTAHLLEGDGIAAEDAGTHELSSCPR